MISLPILITLCIFILGITFSLVKIIYDIIIRRVEALEKSRGEHALAIQSLKDFNNLKVDRIEKDIDELKRDLQAFKEMIIDKIHRDSNIINQQKSLIERLSRYLDEKENSLHKL